MTVPSCVDVRPHRASSVAHVAELAPYTGERLERAERVRFNTAEAAMRWCGEELTWRHFQAEQRSILHGANENGSLRAIVRGPLLAILPESIPVEVVR